jgi:hypothetical protein
MPVHVYGIIAGDTALPSGTRGRRNARLRRVAAAGIAAVVSDVAADDRPKRDDLLAHARVLEAIAASATVLPMRFGVELGSDADVEHDVLEAGASRAAMLLSDLEGTVQLTVKAFHDERAALRDLLIDRPDIRALREAIASGPRGYDAQVRLGQAVAEGLAVMRDHDAALVHERLAPLADRLVLNEARGQHQVLDAALLVRREFRADLDQAIAKLSRELPERLRLRYIGPQPPYSFVGDNVMGEPAWA